jgi:leucyl aminopeptidase
MNVKVENQALSNIEADLLIEIITPKMLEEHPHKSLFDRSGFKAKQDTCSAMHSHARMMVGVDEFKSDLIRSSLAAAIKSLKESGYKSAKIASYGIENTTAIVDAVILGSYSFDTYKSKKELSKLSKIVISNETYDGEMLDFELLSSVANEQIIIAKATNFTRDLVNTIPNDFIPMSFAYKAEEICKAGTHLSYKVIEEDELEDENMNAMLAVSRASRHSPALVHLKYKPKNPKAVVSLVGKGLTYDSGGLSLKPSTSMVTMKMDKAGACAVMGMMQAVDALGLDIEVHGFIGAVENMIGGDAYKPDDVLFSRSKKSVEVRNTDAEGRLVLCDVLDYAQEKVKADYLFDFATLTGACMVALGQYTTGVMGHSNKLKHEIFQASNDSGELVGSLPFNRHLRKLLKSDIADISNVSSKPYGGAITAALFLDEFIHEDMKEKWLHFDIAGSAYTETPWDCYGYGATGSSVRLILKWMQQSFQE